MHVTYLDGRSSPLAASSASPFHPRSDETSSLRLARPTADLRNGITGHPPRALIQRISKLANLGSGVAGTTWTSLITEAVGPSWSHVRKTWRSSGRP